MKTFLALLALLVGLPVSAALPPYQRNYYTTNLNPSPVVTGGDTYITNLTVVSNAYFSVAYVTNLYATTNISYVDFVTWSFTTNLTVVSNAYFFETNFNNYAYTTNLTVESNAFFYSTNFENNTYVTNLYVTSNSVFFETNFVNNSFITNLTVVSNAYFPKNLYVSNLFVTNFENAPGPFVLQPHASTNGFPNALSLSNGYGIKYGTNSPFLTIEQDTTLGSYSSATATNYIGDFSNTFVLISMTNSINFTHSTNRESGKVKEVSIFLENYSGSNLVLSWPYQWRTQETNVNTVTNGKSAILTLLSRGLDETNVYALWTATKGFSVLPAPPPAGPESISNVYFWYKQDVLATSNNGDGINIWYDSTTNAWPTLAPNAGATPYWTNANQLNGLGAVKFDGSSDELLVTNLAYCAFSNIAGAHIYVIARVEEDPGAQPDNLFTAWNEAATSQRLRLFAGTGPFALTETFSRSAVPATAISAAHSTNWTCVEARVDYAAGNAWLWTNNVFAATNYGGWGSGNTDSVSNYVINIGSHNASSFFKGWISEVIFYNRALTDSERITMHNYLMWKYGTYPW